MTNIPQAAIEKAIEGGWKYITDLEHGENTAEYISHHLLTDDNLFWKEVALDPTFWQALGKALGWSDVHDPDAHLNCEILTCWCEMALVFMRLIFAGGDTEKFWFELLQ